MSGDVTVNKFRHSERALRSMIMPIIVVYERPDDYPDEYVARLYDANRATKFVARAATLEDVEQAIPRACVYCGRPGFVRMDRMRGDDPKIVEVWI